MENGDKREFDVTWDAPRALGKAGSEQVVAGVTSNGMKVELKVMVTGRVSATGIIISGEGIANGSVTMKPGDELKLSFTVAPEGASSNVTWSSTDEKVVVVSSNGMLTAVGAGGATICVASVASPDAKAELKVVVKGEAPKPDPQPQPKPDPQPQPNPEPGNPGGGVEKPGDGSQAPGGDMTGGSDSNEPDDGSSQAPSGGNTGLNGGLAIPNDGDASGDSNREPANGGNGSVEQQLPTTGDPAALAAATAGQQGLRRSPRPLSTVCASVARLRPALLTVAHRGSAPSEQSRPASVTVPAPVWLSGRGVDLFVDYQDQFLGLRVVS